MNTSLHVWLVGTADPLNVGNHWLDSGGSYLRLDDGRTEVPALEPCKEVVLGLRCTAPPKPGVYFLEVDLVQEGVTWFAERGASPARLLMTVEQGVAAAGPDEIPLPQDALFADEPRMETVMVPIGEVVAVLEAEVGAGQSISKDRSGYDWWRSYEYIATGRA